MKKVSGSEMNIAFKSARNSFIFAEVFLLVWVILSVVVKDKLSITPLVLLILNAVVFFGSQYYYHKFKPQRIPAERRISDSGRRDRYRERETETEDE